MATVDDLLRQLEPVFHEFDILVRGYQLFCPNEACGDSLLTLLPKPQYKRKLMYFAGYEFNYGVGLRKRRIIDFQAVFKCPVCGKTKIFKPLFRKNLLRSWQLVKIIEININ